MALVEPHLLSIVGEGECELVWCCTLLSKVLVALTLVKRDKRATLTEGKALCEDKGQSLTLTSSRTKCPVEPRLLRAS